MPSLPESFPLTSAGEKNENNPTTSAPPGPPPSLSWRRDASGPQPPQRPFSESDPSEDDSRLRGGQQDVYSTRLLSEGAPEKVSQGTFGAASLTVSTAAESGGAAAGGARYEEPSQGVSQNTGGASQPQSYPFGVSPPYDVRPSRRKFDWKRQRASSAAANFTYAAVKDAAR